MKKIAIIGGFGFEDLSFLSDKKEIKIETPFGNPEAIVTGKIDGTDIVHISRHGKGKPVPSSKVNFLANIDAIKQLKCTDIFTLSTCNSLREEIYPGELIAIDQFIDFTRHRPNTFFDRNNEEMKFSSMASPFSDDLRDDLIEAAILLKSTIHTKSTVITIDGPTSSTRAESYLFKTWGADVINMSTATEVILANETGIPIAALSLCVGYDSWRTDIKPSSLQEVNEVIENNSAKLIDIIKIAVSKV